MKKIFTVVSLVILSLLTHAQIDPVGNFNRHVFEKWKGEYIRIGAYRVKGSPYLLGEAFPGVITYKDGKTVTDEKILYDLYNQKAGIDIKNEIFERNVAIESFTIHLPKHLGDQKLFFKNGSIYGKGDWKGYLNVLEEGEKVTLLKMYKTKLLPDPVNNMDKQLKIFEQYFDYYLYFKSTKSLQNIKLKRKDILKEFGENAFIKNYMSNKAIDFSQESEVIALIKSYNDNL